MPLYARLLALGAFGSLGAVCRYLVGLGALRILPTAPWLGTLIANAVGCFLFGAVFHASVEGNLISENLRVLLLTGFLGAFTTFSAFAFDAVLLSQNRGLGAAGAYVAGQNVLGVLAALAGIALMRAVLAR